MHILSFLDDKSVAAAQLVCRDLHELCNLNSLWARLLQQAYGLRVTADKVGDAAECNAMTLG